MSLLDMTMCFQNKYNFSEAEECLKEAESLYPNHLFVKVLSISNQFFDKSKHKHKKLKEMLESVENVLEKLEENMALNNGNHFMMNMTNLPHIFTFAKDLKNDINKTILFLQKNKKSIALKIWDSIGCQSRQISERTNESAKIEEDNENEIDFSDEINQNWKRIKKIAKIIKHRLLNFIELSTFNENVTEKQNFYRFYLNIMDFLQQFRLLKSMNKLDYLLKNALGEQRGLLTKQTLTSFQKSVLSNLLTSSLSQLIDRMWEDLDVPSAIYLHALDFYSQKLKQKNIEAKKSQNQKNIWIKIQENVQQMRQSMSEKNSFWLFILFNAFVMIVGIFLSEKILFFSSKI